jgi:FkbM family methyltransferase
VSEEDGIYRVDYDGKTWHLPWDDIQEALYLMDYDKERYYDYLNTRDTIVEVGASTGVYSVRAAAEISDTGTLYAIEADPRNYLSLIKNIDHYELDNVLTYNGAISHQADETVEFTQVSGSTTSHGIAETIERSHEKADIPKENYESTTVKTETQTLDSFVDENAIQEIDVLKVTVNGHEAEVLKSGADLLNRTKYVILHVEYPEVVSILNDYGFEVRQRRLRPGEDTHPNGPSIFMNRKYAMD